MSEVFNNKRFWQYAKVRFAANRVFFFVPLFIPGIALLLIMSDLAFGGRTGIMELTFQSFIGFLAFFIFLILYSSRAFSEFHNRNRGFMLATIPASGFEKYLFGLLQVTLGFGVLYALSYFISAFMIAGYNHAIVPDTMKSTYDRPFDFSSMTKGIGLGFIYGNPMQFFNYLTLVLSVSTIFATGSIFFKRFGFLFTSLIFLVYFWLTTNIAAFTFGHSGSNAFGNGVEVFILPFSEGFSKWNHHGIASVISLISLFSVILLLWIASYHRLKEKEF
jgi:hypothetical protein